MTRALTHQTTLAIQVIIKDETGTLAFSILLITKFFAVLNQASRLATIIADEVLMAAGDLTDAVIFTSKVVAIGFSSLAFGLGVVK